MTPIAIAERNKARHLQAKDAFNRGELDRCLEFYSPDHQVMSQPSAKGRAAIREFFASTYRAWPDVRIVVEHVVAEGDWVMGHSAVTATHTETVMGVAPTHRRIETTFWDLHRFDEAGLIVETWSLIDFAAIMKQLGLLRG